MRSAQLSRSLTIFVATLSFLCTLPANRVFAQVNVLNWHNDNGHTGQNLQETILTPANVNTTKFGKLFSYLVDGMMYAQPLYVQGITINGTSHNVVFAATENDSVYAFDADSASLNPNPLWKTSLLSANVTAMPCTDNDPYCNVYPVIGITGTPVINLANQSMYLVARTKEKGPKGGVLYATRLHAINITTGAEQPNSPVLICAAAAAKGCNFAPYTQLTQQFVPQHQMQRPALVLTPYAGTQQGVVYLAFGQDRGWIFAYDAQTMKLLAVFCSAPNVQLSGHGLSGFWGSGGAVAADSLGNLYAATADGVFDADSGGSDYGDTVIKLTLNYDSVAQKYSFQVADYFSPTDQTCRYDNDDDLGSGAPMILPPQLGSNPDLLLMAGKGYPCDGVISPVYLINRDNMGQAAGSTIQTVEGPQAGYWGGGAYWQSATTTYVYYSGMASETAPPAGDNLRAFTMVSGMFSPVTAVAQSPKKLFIGSTPSVSANGTTNGIVWAISRQDPLSQKPGSHPAILYAFDASNVAHQLYSSTTNPTRDTAGAGVKFVAPAIANGKVYVGTQTELDVYGLLGTK
ncbi:MAG TPA: hypothetical protein VI386_31575 [Candidatus Sulfotelmatobacter sp.]